MFEVGLIHYIVLATALFILGLWGVVSSRNVIRVLMCVELMLNSVNINLVAFNNYVHPDEFSGQVFSIFVLTVSAAEAALGLAIVIAMFRSRQTADMEKLNLLKW